MLNNSNFRIRSVYGVAALFIVLALSVGACIAEPTAQTEVGAEIVEDKTLVEGEAIIVESEIEEPVSTGVMNAHETMIRARRLLDYEFKNINGDVTGNIQNILIDVITGKVLFVTIEYGGFLDIGDTHLAMPLSAFSWGLNDEFILNIEEERLQNFPGLGENWPDLSDPLWDDEISQFWLDIDVNPGIDIDGDTSGVMYLSEFLNWRIGDIEFGEGDINDILINLSQSQAAYVVVDYGTSMFDDNLVVIPMGGFYGRSIDNQLYFEENITLDMLEKSPTFDRIGFDEADLFKTGFDEAIVEFWKSEGYISEDSK